MGNLKVLILSAGFFMGGLFVTSSAFAAEKTCVAIFQLPPEPITGTEYINGMELNRQGALYLEKREVQSQTNDLLADTGHTTTRAVQEMRLLRQRFDFELRVKADSLAAANVYRELYENRHLALSELIKYTDAPARLKDETIRRNARFLLPALTRGKMNKDMEKEVADIIDDPVMDVERILDIYDRVLGRVVDEYNYVEWFLQNLEKKPRFSQDPNAAPNVALIEALKENIAYVRRTMSASSLALRFPELEILSDAVIAERAAGIIKSRPLILVSWLELVRDAQGAYKTDLYVKSLLQVQTLQDLVYKFVPAQFKVPISKFIGMNYNVYVLRVYLEDIMSVLDAPTIDSRVKVMMEVGPARDNLAQFLETFARLAPEMESWIEIRNYMAEKAKNEPLYDFYYQEMLKAQAKVPALKFISKLTEPSKFDGYVGWVLPMGGAATTTAVVTFPQWWPWVAQILNL
jgi:hypothetical protein